jgi:hypothetical protein
VTRYVVRVYKGCSYYPDRKLQSLSRGRIDRRMEQLKAEGYEPKLFVVPTHR